jgi:hypothetical protein
MNRGPIVALSVVALLLIAGGVYAYIAFRPDGTPPQPGPDPYAVACGPRPAGVALSTKEIEVAGANIAGFALGTIKASSTPTAFDALTTSSKNGVVADYLMCVAEQREEIQRGNAEQADYLRKMFLFFQTGPTPQQMDQWQIEHPFPRTVGSLDTPDFHNEGDKRILDFGNELVRDVRIINSGTISLSVWVADFPQDVFFPSPNLGPWNVNPGASETITIVLKHVLPNNTKFPFEIKANTGLMLNAEIRISQNLAQGYEELEREILKIPRAGVEGGAWGKWNTELSPKEGYTLTSKWLEQKYPVWSQTTRDLLAANILADFGALPAAKLAIENAGSKSDLFKKSESYKGLIAKFGTYNPT